MRYRISLILLFLANSLFATELSYTSADSHMYVLSYYDDNSDPYDPSPPYYEEYNQTANPPAGELSDYTNTLVGNGFDVSGNWVSGTFSGLNDTSGFSMSGTVENLGAYEGYGHGCTDWSVDCVHRAHMEREIRFTLAEQTTLTFNLNWSDLQGTRDGSKSIAELWVNLQPLHESGLPMNAILVEYVGDYDGISAGSETHEITVEPGGYRVIMRMGAWSNQSAGPIEDAYSVANGSISVSILPGPSVVNIDVLPGDPTNVVYPNRDGKLPVAILGSAEFDATQVDPATLKFGPAEAAPSDPLVISDVDGQHGLDATAKFRMPQTGIFCNDTEVSLTGNTYAGDAFQGTDSIDASDCETGGCHVY